MFRLLLLATALFFSSNVFAADRWLLPVGFPSQIEHGLQLMRNTELQAAMQRYDQSELGSVLEVFHGKTPEQQALAAQLRDWLLVLGMQSEDIVLKPSRKLKLQLALEIDEP